MGKDPSDFIDDLLKKIGNRYLTHLAGAGKIRIGEILPPEILELINGSVDSVVGEATGNPAGSYIEGEYKEVDSPDGQLVAGKDFGLIVILGAEQSGKTSLAYALAYDQHKKGKPVFIVTSAYLPISSKPDFVQIIDLSDEGSIQKIPNGAVLLIDDAAEYFGSLSYYAKESQQLKTLKNVAAHKGLLIIATLQQIRDSLRVLRFPQILYIKNPNIVYLDNEPIMYKKLILEAKEKFDSIPLSERPAYTYAVNMLSGDKQFFKLDKPTWLSKRHLLNKYAGPLAD